MKGTKLNIFFNILRIFLGISIIVSGLCLIYGCLCIYYSGNDPSYSPEAVRLAFNKIAIPVYICLGLLALSIVLPLFFPSDSKKIKIKVSSKGKYGLLLVNKDVSNLSVADNNTLKKEKTSRTIIKSVEFLIIAVLSALFLIYALNGSNFDSKDINSSMINAMKVLIPCTVLMLVVSIVSYLLCEQSFKRACAILTKLPKTKEEKTNAKDNRAVLIIRSVILLTALVLLIYGFATGGVADVLTKAVNICTECIGLG